MCFSKKIILKEAKVFIKDTLTNYQTNINYFFLTLFEKHQETLNHEGYDPFILFNKFDTINKFLLHFVSKGGIRKKRYNTIYSMFM